MKPKIEPKEEVIEKDSFGIFEKSTENVNIEGTSEANPEIEANTAETSENVSRKSNIDNVEIDSPPNETYSNNKEFYDWVSIKSYLKSRRNEAKFLNLKELFVKMYPRLESVKTKNKSIQNSFGLSGKKPNYVCRSRFFFGHFLRNFEKSDVVLVRLG